MAIVIYSGAICFTELILDLGTDEADELVYWFGSVPRTGLILFEAIAFGVDWDGKSSRPAHERMRCAITSRCVATVSSDLGADLVANEPGS